jgi:uncharacterized protein (DUF1778 family)
MSLANRRTERMEARLLPEQKIRIERAANLKGLSFSDFMVQHADEAAIRTIQQHASWTLENKDKDRVFIVQALIQPPEPSSRLKSAARRYKNRLHGQ